MGPFSVNLVSSKDPTIFTFQGTIERYCILDSNINNLFFFCVVKEKVEKENSIWYQNKNDLSSFV